MSSYLLPFDTLYNVWWTAVPVYDLEAMTPPAVLPEGQANQKANTNDAACADAAAASANETTDDETPEQTMRLVFKGVKWIPIPAYNIRENLYYNLLQESERDADEQRSLARKPAPPRPQPSIEDEAGPDEASSNHTEPTSDD